MHSGARSLYEMASFDLFMVPRFYDSLTGLRGRGGELSQLDLASAFASTAGDELPHADLRRLHSAFTALSQTLSRQAQPSSWMSNLRRNDPTGRDASARGAPDALKAFCCGIAVLCDGSMAEKLEAGVALCGGRQRALDLQGVLLMLQGGLYGAQHLLHHYYVHAPPPGMRAEVISLLRFDWSVIEGLLRETARARAAAHVHAM